MTKLLKIWVITPLLLLSLGCAEQNLAVTEILNYNQCQGLEPGLAQISLPQLAKLRGTRLLQVPGETARSTPADTPTEHLTNVLLISVYQGQHPTAGFKLDLVGAKQTGRHLDLNYTLVKPGPDTMVAQMITRPCSVVQIADHNQPDSIFQGTVAVWIDSKKLGQLASGPPLNSGADPAD